MARPPVPDHTKDSLSSPTSSSHTAGISSGHPADCPPFFPVSPSSRLPNQRANPPTMARRAPTDARGSASTPASTTSRLPRRTLVSDERHQAAAQRFASHKASAEGLVKDPALKPWLLPANPDIAPPSGPSTLRNVSNQSNLDKELPSPPALELVSSAPMEVSRSLIDATERPLDTWTEPPVSHSRSVNWDQSSRDSRRSKRSGHALAIAFDQAREKVASLNSNITDLHFNSANASPESSSSQYESEVEASMQTCTGHEEPKRFHSLISNGGIDQSPTDKMVGFDNVSQGGPSITRRVPVGIPRPTGQINSPRLRDRRSAANGLRSTTTDTQHDRMAQTAGRLASSRTPNLNDGSLSASRVPRAFASTDSFQRRTNNIRLESGPVPTTPPPPPPAHGTTIQGSSGFGNLHNRLHNTEKSLPGTPTDEPSSKPSLRASSSLHRLAITNEIRKASNSEELSGAATYNHLPSLFRAGNQTTIRSDSGEPGHNPLSPAPEHAACPSLSDEERRSLAISTTLSKLEGTYSASVDEAAGEGDFVTKLMGAMSRDDDSDADLVGAHDVPMRPESIYSQKSAVSAHPADPTPPPTSNQAQDSSPNTKTSRPSVSDQARNATPETALTTPRSVRQQPTESTFSRGPAPPVPARDPRRPAVPAQQLTPRRLADHHLAVMDSSPGGRVLRHTASTPSDSQVEKKSKSRSLSKTFSKTKIVFRLRKFFHGSKEQADCTIKTRRFPRHIPVASRDSTVVTPSATRGTQASRARGVTPNSSASRQAQAQQSRVPVAAHSPAPPATPTPGAARANTAARPRQLFGRRNGNAAAAAPTTSAAAAAAGQAGPGDLNRIVDTIEQQPPSNAPVEEVEDIAMRIMAHAQQESDDRTQLMFLRVAAAMMTSAEATRNASIALERAQQASREANISYNMTVESLNAINRTMRSMPGTLGFLARARRALPRRRQH